MNVYDFDNTIFNGDTEDRFFDYIFARRKDLWVYKLNHDFWEHFYKCRWFEDKTWIRELQYLVLRKLDNVDEMIDGYCEESFQYIQPWYLEVKRPDDVIATGSPVFLVAPILKKLGISGLVATDLNKHTGKITGHFANYGFKVTEFQKKYNLDDIDEFYSDAWSDHYIAKYAKKAYLVHGDGQRTEWNEYFSTHPKK